MQTSSMCCTFPASASAQRCCPRALLGFDVVCMCFLSGVQLGLPQHYVDCAESPSLSSPAGCDAAKRTRGVVGAAAADVLVAAAPRVLLGWGVWILAAWASKPCNEARHCASPHFKHCVSSGALHCASAQEGVCKQLSCANYNQRTPAAYAHSHCDRCRAALFVCSGWFLAPAVNALTVCCDTVVAMGVCVCVCVGVRMCAWGWILGKDLVCLLLDQDGCGWFGRADCRWCDR